MSVELLVDLDEIDEADFADYLSSDDEPYKLPDPIAALRRKIKEPVHQFAYLRVVVNVLWLVEGHMLEGSSVAQKISVAVLVLDSYPQLNDLKQQHYSTCEDMYRLAFSRKLEYIRKINEPPCYCAIL